MKSVYYTGFLSFLMMIVFFSCREGEYSLEENAIVIRDLGGGTGTTTWTSDNTYMLEGKVFVNEGQILTIEAGTVIRARTGQGSASTALIVARGGKIIAGGASEAPIIFTVEGDDLQGAVPLLSKGLWGGLIILGNAQLNIQGGEAHVEGISIDEPRALYGGDDDADNSGILQYVSIRHGGTNIGEGNEINGLTLAGVGNGTIIEHVEIISNADDGIEFFGGTVNCRNIIVAYCGDDAIDYDMGYRGKGQYWLAVEDPAVGDNLIEADGGVDPVVGTPYSIPEIYNVTFIGRGNEIEDHLIEFYDNAGGKIANSVFLKQGKGVDVEYDPDRDDSYRQFELGKLEIKNNIFYEVAGDSPETIFKVVAEPGVNTDEQNAAFQSYFVSADNDVSDPGIEMENMKFNPIPKGNVYENLAPYPSDWFEKPGFKGAFGSYNWAYGWSLISNSGMLR
ncbi:MAG: hypothetical protein K9G67_05290 [Bacteroidales bacterium]|nr:hypothetical protein [Bacteroidales bacterium]MCF8343279.1 hypothetical protein [Bacteroidales bacterium]MCF8350851.1 hypothetical protein [Bacteroidales bacterium]MCF8375748.1 hypothetical protein [Bacteroidales bacterium]MCF8400348.1 hypothetical protein [Bacteroidales bacterium]